MPNIITRGAMSAKALGFTGQTTTPVYVEDVFSTYLYTGNGSTQTITNGIDLSTKGGMVWFKRRDAVGNNTLTDTVNNGRLLSDATNALNTNALVSSFNTDGFSLNTAATPNQSAATFTSWTFRKQAKFFDIVTYTGTGSARTISHNLGATPGMIIVKRTDTTGNWQVYHNGLTSAANSIQLNLTSAQASATTVWNSTAPTSSVFSVGTDATVNASGGTYVAYLYAASNSGGFGLSGTDSVVACGSWSGTNAVSLGWEPQIVLYKLSDGAGNWELIDNMRGFGAASISCNILYPNTSGAEVIGGRLNITSTGFTTIPLGAQPTETYIYLAIRRGPMKVPTDATKVFSPVIWTGNNTTSRQISTGLLSPPDLSITQFTNGVQNNLWWDKLRGLGSTASMVSAYLRSPTTATESSLADYYNTPTMTAVGFGTTSSSSIQLNGSGASVVAWNCRRAPGFFDIVCYTGTGSATTVAHNLGVAPEMMIVKARNQYDGWYTYHSGIGNTKQVLVNGTNAEATYSGWNNTSPTISVFSVNGTVNEAEAIYVAYLFATCSGVSKVGSYTGTGAAQNINCGFSASARYVLIKRTDSTGDWYVYDSARGISSGNDPYLLLNSGAAQVTGTNYVDTFASGFTLTASAPAGLNANGGSYIFLAIA